MIHAMLFPSQAQRSNMSTLTSSRTEIQQSEQPNASEEVERKRERRRWIALAVLCLGQLMMVLDATIVNVALPSIQRDLNFTQGNLTWVIDGYLITFGGFLLLAGRVGDLIGRKKVFLAGLVLFTSAPVAGSRRSCRLERDPRDHRDRVPRGQGAGEGDGYVRVRICRWRLDRAAGRGSADAVA